MGLQSLQPKVSTGDGLILLFSPLSEIMATTPGGTRSSIFASGKVVSTAKAEPSGNILSLMLSLGCFVLVILALILVHLERLEVTITWSAPAGT